MQDNKVIWENTKVSSYPQCKITKEHFIEIIFILATAATTWAGAASRCTDG